MKKTPDYKPQLYVPQPDHRPGDIPTFEHIKVPEVDILQRPDPLCSPFDTKEQAKGLIRVLDFEGNALGKWNPQLPDKTLLMGLKNMLLTRAMDDRLFRMQRQNKMSFYMKSLGEEAIGSAQAMATRQTDMIFPTYRIASAALARGIPMQSIMCQCLSNAGDTMTKGRQMPVMYTSKKHGFFSVSGNLGTQTIQAVGWAMANAYKGSNDIALAYTGEGATAEGDFHYALNFASTHRAPVIINVVNNQWAISTFQGIAGGQSKTFARRSQGYGLAALRVDGNDFLAVHAVTQWAAERARNGGGATVIEHFTYRAEGHSTSDDPHGYRPRDEGQAWPLGDPVERLKQHLINLGCWSEEQHQELLETTKQLVLKTYKEAEAIGYATSGGTGGIDPASMFEDVFEEMPEHLQQQQRKSMEN